MHRSIELRFHRLSPFSSSFFFASLGSCERIVGSPRAKRGKAERFEVAKSVCDSGACRRPKRLASLALALTSNIFRGTLPLSRLCYLFVRVKEKLRVVQEHLLWGGDRGVPAALPPEGDGACKERAAPPLENAPARPLPPLPPPARAAGSSAQGQWRDHWSRRGVSLAAKGERIRCAVCCPGRAGRDDRSFALPLALALRDEEDDKNVER